MNSISRASPSFRAARGRWRMGPGTPWLSELAEFGLVVYLAGTRVIDGRALRATVAEDGGVRIFGAGVPYFVAKRRSGEKRGSQAARRRK